MKKQARRKAQQSQKTKFLLWGLVALFILGASAVWFLFQDTTEQTGYPREVSVEEAVTKRDAGAFILDVRQPEEWNEFHIPDSTLIPLAACRRGSDVLGRNCSPKRKRSLITTKQA